MRSVLVLFAALLFAPSVSADECHPIPARGEKAKAVGARLLESNDPGDVSGAAPSKLSSLAEAPALMRQTANLVACDLPADAATPAMLRQRADEIEHAVVDEQRCRAEDRCMALRVCDADENARQLEALIAQEKANPTGVVSLVRLHSLGEDLQANRADAASARKLFATVRKKAFKPAYCAAVQAP